MQRLKNLITQRNVPNGVFLGGEKWNPGPFGFLLRSHDAKYSTEQMTPKQRIACTVDPFGNRNEAEAVLAACREELTRLAEQERIVKD